jgi:Protein of unknown function (DUF664)
MISVEDWFSFVDEALDGMSAVLLDLGDRLVNSRVDAPESNTAYAVVTHCLGVMDYLGGWLVAGRTVQRDRDAEFRATGNVALLPDRVRVTRELLSRDVKDLDPCAPPRRAVEPAAAGLPLGRTQGGALIHLYEELAQHRGQFEVTRDVLLAAAAR